MDDLRTEILATIAGQTALEPSQFRLEATPAELGLTSIDLVEIVFALEQAYGIEVPYDDPALDGRPLGELVAAVERLVAARRAG